MSLPTPGLKYEARHWVGRTAQFRLDTYGPVGRRSARSAKWKMINRKQQVPSSHPQRSLSMTNRLSSQPPEDWDHPESMVDTSAVTTTAPAPSRVVFPSRGGATDDDPDTPPTPDALPSHSHRGGRSGKRTLSELLKLHAEKGTDVNFTSEEAARLEDLLGQWVLFSLLLSFYVNVYDGLTSLLGPCSRYVDVDQLELVAIRRGR